MGGGNHQLDDILGFVFLDDFFADRTMGFITILAQNLRENIFGTFSKHRRASRKSKDMKSTF